MSKSIYVGNLSYSSTEQDIRELFEQHGNVTDVSVLMDRMTGRSRGFGFVEMDDADADRAIEALDGADCDGRNLRVNIARERGDRGSTRRW